MNKNSVPKEKRSTQVFKNSSNNIHLFKKRISSHKPNKLASSSNQQNNFTSITHSQRSNHWKNHHFDSNEKYTNRKQYFIILSKLKKLIFYSLFIIDLISE